MLNPRIVLLAAVLALSIGSAALAEDKSIVVSSTT